MRYEKKKKKERENEQEIKRLGKGNKPSIK